MDQLSNSQQEQRDRLFDSFAFRIAHSGLKRHLQEDMIVPREEWNDYYHHFTIRVHSLSEYIDVVCQLAEISRRNGFEALAFRGHTDASSNYKLVPAIGRKSVSLMRSENAMVNEMLTLRPEEFSGITSDFELLSKLQHFGLPTRLLDFTYNPLVALFFACYSPMKADESRVICTSDTSSTDTKDLIESVCGTYRNTDYKAVSLDALLGGVSTLRRYALYTKEPLMAKPKYSNERIKHQEAVFMVFPNAVTDLRSRMVVLGRKNGDEEEYRRFLLSDEENERLHYIRKEPDIYDDSFCVDSSTLSKQFGYYQDLFGDFDSKTEFGISPKYHFLFKSRFSIDDSIQELSRKMISRDFISILINYKDRKRIIKDLRTIGIDKAFIFPELEYTTEMVKNRYYDDYRKWL